MGGSAAWSLSEQRRNTGSGRPDMSTAQPPTMMPAYPDRSTRLTVFGIFQILLGCVCGLIGLMLVVVPTMGPTANAPQGQAMNTRMMIPGMVIYLLLAVAFVWLGIGSLRARRWAWTLTVVLSWMWLVMGVVMFVSFVFVAGPMMSATIAQQGKMRRKRLWRCGSSVVRSRPASIFSCRPCSCSSTTASPCVRPVRGEIRRSAGPTAVPCRCSP